MSDKTIPPCPVCGTVPETEQEKIYCTCPHNCGEYKTQVDIVQTCDCRHFMYLDVPVDASGSLYDWVGTIETLLGRACRELGIGTVEQLRELVGIACDACDERTVRAANRAENLVPLLRRRAAKGEKKYGR